MTGDMPVHVSEYVPEMVDPPPCKRLRYVPARRGGRRTDFGRYFRADSFARGTGKPSPPPKPGAFVLNGELHVHPKTWERLKAGLRITMEMRAPRMFYMDGMCP